MVKLFQKDRIKFLIIITLTSILCSFCLMGKIDKSIDLISTLTTSNYICLILNNLYIYYKKSKKYKR